MDDGVPGVDSRSGEPGLPLTFRERVRLFIFTPFYILLGVVLLISTPLLALISGVSRVGRQFVYQVVLHTTIPALRYFLDTVPTWLVHAWWLRSQPIAQDGEPVMKDVAVGEQHVYGTHPRENLYALYPCRYLRSPSVAGNNNNNNHNNNHPNSSHNSISISNNHNNNNNNHNSTAADKLHPTIGHRYGEREAEVERHILYVHGGGWIAANATCLTPSTTAFARAGYVTWMMNYPLSPEAVFPEAIRSVLKAMSWLKRERSVTHLALIGDSAGGNLVSVATALTHLPTFVSELFDGDEHAVDLPVVIGMSSMYGILDRESWLMETSAISVLENVLSRFALRFLFYAYTGNLSFSDPLPIARQPLEGRITLCDLLPLLSAYPPTLLIVGNLDCLVHSSRRAHRELTDKGFVSQLVEYEARHAFFGLPPGLNSCKNAYLSHAKPAFTVMLRFLAALPWAASQQHQLQHHRLSRAATLPDGLRL